MSDGCLICEAEGQGKLVELVRKILREEAANTIFKQHRFPRSKKRRIRKKWAKNPDNWVTLIGVKKPRAEDEDIRDHDHG